MLRNPVNQLSGWKTREAETCGVSAAPYRLLSAVTLSPFFVLPLPRLWLYVAELKQRNWRKEGEKGLPGRSSLWRDKPQPLTLILRQTFSLTELYRTTGMDGSSLARDAKNRCVRVGGCGTGTAKPKGSGVWVIIGQKDSHNNNNNNNEKDNKNRWFEFQKETDSLLSLLISCTQLISEAPRSFASVPPSPARLHPSPWDPWYNRWAWTTPWAVSFDSWQELVRIQGLDLCGRTCQDRLKGPCRLIWLNKLNKGSARGWGNVKTGLFF